MNKDKPTVADRPTLRAGARKRITFEITPRAHALLREDAHRRGMTQILLLEMMVRHYCDPDRTSYDPEGKF